MRDERLSEIALRDLVAEVLRRIGEDVGRPGLVKTPERVEKSLQWLTRGYGLSVDRVIGKEL